MDGSERADGESEPIVFDPSILREMERAFPRMKWVRKARENVDKWGEQDVDTLLLAMQEELGECSQAHLEARHEGADPERIRDELDDLAALCVQLRWRLDGKTPV